MDFIQVEAPLHKSNDGKALQRDSCPSEQKGFALQKLLFNHFEYTNHSPYTKPDTLEADTCFPMLEVGHLGLRNRHSGDCLDRPNYRRSWGSMSNCSLNKLS